VLRAPEGSAGRGNAHHITPSAQGRPPGCRKPPFPGSKRPRELDFSTARNCHTFFTDPSQSRGTLAVLVASDPRLVPPIPAHQVERSLRDLSLFPDPVLSICIPRDAGFPSPSRPSPAADLIGVQLLSRPHATLCGWPLRPARGRTRPMPCCELAWERETAHRAAPRIHLVEPT